MTGTKAYLSAVDRALDCLRSLRRELLDGLHTNLSDSDDDYGTLCAIYGAPDAAAQELLECVDPEVLRKTKKKKRIIISSLVAATLVVAISACAFLGRYYAIAREYVEVDGDFVVVTTMEVSEEKEISDAEFQQLMEQAKKGENIEKTIPRTAR